MDTRPPPVWNGRRSGQKTRSVGDGGSGDWLSNFLSCIGGDVHGNVSSDFAMQFDRDGEVAQALDRLGELNFPAVEIEAFGSEFTGDVGGGDGAEELTVFAGLAGEAEGEWLE